MVGNRRMVDGVVIPIPTLDQAAIFMFEVLHLLFPRVELEYTVRTDGHPAQITALVLPSRYVRLDYVSRLKAEKALFPRFIGARETVPRQGRPLVSAAPHGLYA